MSYQALYRTWRPQSFASLLGQPHVRQTLMNAITSGKIAHAYLFCGPRGTGKTSAAKLFAKAVNCENPNGAEPCNVCDACVSITRGSNVDVEEIDAASNRGVDEIRELRDKVHYAPTTVRRKVYIVDEVHMLTTEAFNALLKTLEEPPGHVLFMLATTEPHKIPNTIISRCQRFDFHRISTETIVERLQEVVRHQDWTCDAGALWKLAEAADGGLRDALGLLEQAAAFGQGHIDEQQVATVIGGVDTAALLSLVGELLDQAYLPAIERLSGWYSNGKDANRIAFDLLQVLRDLFIVMLSDDDAALNGKPVEPYRNITKRTNCTTEWLLQGVTKLGELYTQMRYVEQPRLALEACLLGMSSAPIPVHMTGAAQVQPSVQPIGRAPSVDARGPSQSAGPSSPSSVGQPAASAPGATDARDRHSGSEEHVPAQDATAQPQGDLAHTTPETALQATRRQQSAANLRAAGAQRKRETLERLYRDRDEELEVVVRERWGDVLHKVKQERIQTHAWLMNGEVVMTTDFAVVLSFASRIHREAVMKPADRKVIEEALSTMMERDMQIFALLKSDWDEFLSSLEQTQDVTDDSSDDIVSRVKLLFGSDKVVIDDKE
ncbi:DNA polymerase III subunit gamma/tau [Alicyclobacillus dauci]|uniref:DNA-directed DNA polymerase n=1 Tax=Alicyclobacillus dauci TaxID=1475485 RepID=A0ABY6Z526_9BACL|nr:DNA polymerase III subunit gamma/tau [Alicyclobacillus dauci]WAH37301.1 DNA polymerase III subunit gamma/tau [Alicyclobacillus dauci]